MQPPIRTNVSIFFTWLLASAAPAIAAANSASVALANLPLRFEANVGQTDSSVAYLTRGSGYSMFLTRTETVLALTAHGKDPAAVRLQWLGTSSETRISGFERLPTITKYLTGDWSKDVPSYAKVRYTGLYPGIDALYYGKEGQLEFDLIVAPGADPARPRFQVLGAGALSVDTDGDLIIHLDSGEIRQCRPVVYQNIGGRRRAVPSRYVLDGGNRVGFAVNGYDRAHPLVIDPVLAYSTYLGGASEDKGAAVAVDSSGNVYVTGTTSSQAFPGTKGPASAISYAFLTKVTAAGDQIPFSLYIGGAKGYTQGQGVAVSGNYLYLIGTTSSADFYTVGAIKPAVTGSSDAFVMKLSTDGATTFYSTLLGGSDGEFGYAVAADTDGNAYLCGMTQSTDFPTTNGAQRSYGGGIADSFVAKLDPAGKLVFGTYIGGSADDRAYAVALDPSRNIYVAGYTVSADFPKAPYQNLGAFAVKLSADGSSFLYSLALGALSKAQGIAVDAFGAAYIVGYSPKQSGWPSQPGDLQPGYGGGSNDAFVTKINSAGNALVYSTYLGGSGDETAYAIAVDAGGSAYVAGETTSANFPTVNGLQPQLAGAKNAFLAVLNPGGSALTYSSFLGGSGSDSATGIALTPSGSAVLTGVTNSLNFPTAHPLQSGLGGSNKAYNDAFVSRIDFTSGAGPSCSYSLDKTSISSVASGGTAVVHVSAPSGCPWTADASAAPFLIITSGTSGNGNGDVVLLLYPNTSASSRSGTLTIAGTTVTVTQAGASNTYVPTVLSLGDPAAVNLPAVSQSTLFYNYYSFRADVPQNSTELVIDLWGPQNVNVDLAVKFGSDVSLNGTVVADYFSNGAGAIKHLVIKPASGAATLQPGSYYIAFVQNTVGQAVIGTITATVTTSAMSGAKIISLGAPASGSLTKNSGRSVYYSNCYADTYQLTISQRTTVSLTISSSGFAPYALIYDSNGTNVGEMGEDSSGPLLTTPLAPGTYWIEVSTVMSNDVGSYTFEVDQVAQSNLSITSAGVTNSASFLSGGVSPGELVTVFGANLGPEQTAFMQVQDGKVATSVAGVRVLVNDVPAPIVSALSGQVSFVMPYGVEAVDWVEIQVEYQGNRSNFALVPVVSVFPGLYQDATGQAAALNEDGSANSASNPAQAGQYIVLYGTGQGETIPGGVDGVIAGSTLQYPRQPVTVQIGGVNAEVSYAGSAPGLVEGILQINAKIPTGMTPGSKVPVVVSIGTATCSATISVK